MILLNYILYPRYLAYNAIKVSMKSERKEKKERKKFILVFAYCVLLIKNAI